MTTGKLSNWQRLALIAGVACSAGMLAGCSFSAGVGTTGHQLGDDIVATDGAFENLVATTLAEEINNGATPTIDCGDDDIQLKNDRVQQCELSVADDPDTVYDVAVTISDVVSYDDYHVAIQVAEAPK